jgi:hypothetical protein
MHRSYVNENTWTELPIILMMCIERQSFREGKFLICKSPCLHMLTMASLYNDEASYFEML